MSGGGDHIRVFERVVCLSGCYQARDVGDIGHQIGSHIVTDLPEPSIVEVARVSGKPRNDHVWFEVSSLPVQLIVVDELGVCTETVLRRFPE